ncbi:MAG: tetratricopeptide repeat protein [Acidobacteriota bacterium]
MKRPRTGRRGPESILVPLLVGVLLVSAGFGSQGAGSPAPGNLWALVIGIGKYTHAEPLLYAASDAQAISSFLQSPRGGGILPDHIFTLLEDQATRRSIEVELELMQDRVEPGDTVYIYLAGHGFINKRGLGYFIPSDGDLRVPASTSVSFQVLKEMVDLGLAHAQRRILITDLCNSGRIGPETTNLASQIQNLINAELLKLGSGNPGSFLNLLASKPTEASWESDDLGRGVFTHTLLEALDGKGLESGERVVQAQHVVNYVTTEVPKYTGNQQHPMANDTFDPVLPLAFLDRPGPQPLESQEKSETVLEILNSDRRDFVRVQWTDPATQSRAVRRLKNDGGAIRIGGLEPGVLELQFYDSENQIYSIPVTLEVGDNTLNLLDSEIVGFPLAQPKSSQVAALSPAFVLAAPLQAQEIAGVNEDAILMLRLGTTTDIYIDGDYFGTGEGEERFLQLQGLSTGTHSLRFVPSPLREYRFRVSLFSGSQVFDLESAELRSMTAIESPPTPLDLPPSIPRDLEPIYRGFDQALWEERVIEPAGNSAWDYYQQLQGTLPAAVSDPLKYRLVVAMGNRAQRTILKYLRGGDVRWDAATFEEGEALIERTQTLFKATDELGSQQRFFSGRALIERGEFGQAVQILRASVVLDSEASHSFNALGLALWRQNLLLQAMVPLEQAIELSPRWTYPRITLSLIFLELRRYQEAEQNLRLAIEINGEDSTAYHALGQLYSLLGRWDEAEVQLEQAIEMNPGNSYAHETLGKLYQLLQRFDQAEDLLRLAIRLEPDEPSFYISLGEFLQQRNRLQDAAPIFARVMDQNPNHPLVLLGYARYLAAQERIEEADDIFKRAIELSPEDANLQVRFGLFLQDQQRGRDAERAFKNAIEISPNNAFAHYNLANLYLVQRNLSQTEKELTLAMEADSRLAAPPMLLGQIRFAQERYPEALVELRKALDLSIEANQQLELREYVDRAEQAIVNEKIAEAESRIQKKDYREAWSIYADALASAPENRELRDAILQFQSRHSEAAVVTALPMAYLRQVLDTHFWRNQGRAERLWQEGQRSQATTAFLQSLEDLGEAEKTLVGSTLFNLRNEQHSVHQLVYRWGLRLIEQQNYSAALELLETSSRQNILGQVPELVPITIDSLMIAEDVPDPQEFNDYEIAYHPDRRAHQLYATALAGSGDLSRALEYLPAIEGRQPDLKIRLAMAKTLLAEQLWHEAIPILEVVLTDTDSSVDSELLAEAFVVTAQAQCQSGDCEAGRATLERGRAVLPDSERIKSAVP